MILYLGVFLLTLVALYGLGMLLAALGLLPLLASADHLPVPGCRTVAQLRLAKTRNMLLCFGR